MSKKHKGQFWKENSMAIHHDDHIIYVQSSVTSFDERILLKITSCDAKDPEIHYRAKLELHEIEALISMLHDARHHHMQMDKLELLENDMNKEQENVQRR